MNIKDFDIEHILKCAHSPVKNYVIPGLTSYLVGAELLAHRTLGCVRLFMQEIHQQGSITPHSHRYDFHCVVLDGWVENRVWKKTEDQKLGDLYQLSQLTMEHMGKYKSHPVGTDYWVYEDKTYLAGDTYSMADHEIHSIVFSKGAKVLFFEGPSKHNASAFLEPVVDGEVIPTLKIEPWMFKR